MNNTLSAILKTAVVGAVGAAGPFVLSAIDHPSGGMASAIAHNPAYALCWTATAYFAHNLWDHYFGAPQK